jgi:hypothetical protein
LKSAVYSARVKRSDTAPVSLFLVAPPESGKTSLALEAAGKHSAVLTDCSAIGILQELQSNPEATHIILTDLTAVAGHKQSVQTLTIAVLNALAEEGSYKIALPHMQHLDMKGRKAGVIACCVPSMLSDNRRWWNTNGFASRMLILRYSHSPSLVLRILSAIAADNGKGKPRSISAKTEVKEQYIDIPRRQSKAILELSRQLAVSNGEVGYRKLKQLRSLACGHALMRKARSVSIKDVDLVSKTIEYMLAEVQLR